jgi:signal transduction histidine kinase
VAVPFGVVATSAVVLAANESRLPLALDQEVTPDISFGSVLLGHPALVVTQLFTVACFVLAAALFTAQGRRGDDQLVQWLGPALALGALARLHYALYPSLYSDWVSTGDLLRTACYLVLLVGAVREIGAYWGARARVAVIEDRRRLARELHDGVVQELGYIRSESGALRSVDPPRTERILGACDRALDEARQAVEAMGSSAEEEPLGFTVHRAARQVADRFGLGLEVELNDTVTADQPQRHALLRIVREAVSNAARHGGAEKVKVEVQRLSSGGRRLVVCDEGTGFDVRAATTRRTGFGLTSMRERAEGLPGTFSLESSAAGGTTIMVTW